MSRPIPLELTAVYEPQANGTIIAYVAEVPGASVVARNMDEARARLAERLQQTLSGERDAALARLGPDARVEALPIDADRHDTHVDAAHHDTRVEAARPAGESDLLRLLREQGRIGALPEPLADDDFEPVRVAGRPISQEIIEGRR
jgi:hypothetical protein